MKQSDLKELIKECYKEVLAEEYEPDYSEYSNDALTDMIINLSRYEGNEDIILDSLSLNLYNSMKQGIVDNFNSLNNLKIADDAVYEEIQKCIS